MPRAATPPATRFRPSLSGILITLAGCVFLCGLGTWQVARFHEKQALWDGFATGTDRLVDLPRASTPPPRYSHVKVAGRYLTDRQFLLDNMTHDGEAGYRVLTPLEAGHGETVLVDRGWVPHRASGRMPELAVTTDAVELTGRTDDLPRRGVDLKDNPAANWPRLMSYPRMDALERALGRTLYPQIVLLDPDAPGGYVRDWQPPGLPPAQHLGYAITWYTCALTLLGLFVYRSRRPASER